LRPFPRSGTEYVTSRGSPIEHAPEGDTRSPDFNWVTFPLSDRHG